MSVFTRILIITTVIFAFSLNVTASEEIDSIIENVPEKIREELPAEEITVDSFGFDFVFEKLSKIVKSVFPSAFSSFSKITGILLFSSAMGLHFKDALGGKMSAPVSLISTLSIAIIILGTQSEIIEKIKITVGSLTAFVTSSAPILSAIQAMTANTLGAAVTSQGFLYFSAAAEFVFTYIFLPIYELFIAFSVVSSVSPSPTGITSVTAFLKRSFTLLLSAASMIYVTVLSYQTELAAASDSVLSRSVKFAVSSSVPIIGGSVSDAVRTTISGFSVIKNSAGALGIVVLLLLTVPIIAELFLLSLSYGITAFTAKMIGCEREASLLTEARTVTDFMIAVISIATVVFIISLAIFIKTTPAIST